MTSFELKEHILENFHDIYEYNYLEFRSHLLAIFFLPFIYIFDWKIIALQCCIGLILPFFKLGFSLLIFFIRNILIYFSS